MLQNLSGEKIVKVKVALAFYSFFVKGFDAYPESNCPPEDTLSQLEQLIVPLGMLWNAQRTQNIWTA